MTSRRGIVTLVLCVVALACCAMVATAQNAEDAKKCVSDCACQPGELCSPKTGACEPAYCPEIRDPVCGLDGTTYGNACEAHAAHIVVAYEGECDKVCGGIAGIPCDRGEVCDLPPGECKSADLQGVCKKRPEGCPEIWDPVCGCNGVTYGNDCERLRDGAQLAHEGACAYAEDVTTCEKNADCGSGEYCNFPIGACGPPGRCEIRPGICTFEFDPVCGCDGVTYSNACHAAAGGVSLKFDSACGG